LERAFNKLSNFGFHGGFALKKGAKHNKLPN